MSVSPRLPIPHSQVAVNPASTGTACNHRQVQTAIIYCEANFGAIDGKTYKVMVLFPKKSSAYKLLLNQRALLQRTFRKKVWNHLQKLLWKKPVQKHLLRTTHNPPLMSKQLPRRNNKRAKNSNLKKNQQI